MPAGSRRIASRVPSAPRSEDSIHGGDGVAWTVGTLNPRVRVYLAGDPFSLDPLSSRRSSPHAGSRTQATLTWYARLPCKPAPHTPTSREPFPLDELLSSALLRMLAPRRPGKAVLRMRRFGASSGEPQHIGEEEEEETQAVTFRDAIMMIMQNSRNWGQHRLATQLSASVRHL